MESRILLLGPVCAGKTTLVRTISEIDPVDTDVQALDELQERKSTTTVAMDVGVLPLDGGDRIVLYGTPGQDRFDFMWEILYEQCDAALLVLDHAADGAGPLHDLHRYHAAWTRMDQDRNKPLVVAVTRSDLAPERPLSLYRAYFGSQRARCGCGHCTPPIQFLDARSRHDVRAVLVALAAILEVRQRFNARPCAGLSAR
jgi:uncharacterized protein